jgi:hypothetical protein
MTRDLLHQTAREVENVRDDVDDDDVRNRLATLADRLQSQAEREATPALGTLDRIQNALREIAAEIDDETVSDRLENAREQIFEFLGTLDDRGMKQHGWSENTESDAPTNQK